MNFRKIVYITLISTLTLNFLFAQKNKSNSKPSELAKKYNSLMWEISSKGSSKKSYLFGTMHVSSKLAFNLSDTFYNAIKRVDVVAIENNPLTWQQEYLESIFTKMGSLYSVSNNQMSNDYISKSSFQFSELDNDYKVALAMDPEIINHFLYRSYTNAADFEEDTYLDMHIFQCGRRLNKKVIGLENFKETEGLILQGMRAEAAESKLRSRSNEVDDDEKNNSKSLNEKIQDAYRNGDLDLLDSLNKKEFRNESFNKFFLDERNRIHASGIENVIKNNQTIFAAVGAAHLPGKNGVIEMLRNKGFIVKPIIMGMQLSKQRDEINKIFLPVKFEKQFADDSFFSVSTPGKLYNFNYASNGQKQWLHADFSNGAYYMVNRLSTNGLLWGKNENDVYKKIDSLLYENIPGKILERNTITNNGYKGFNIVNKTRKGDVQRYNIFITPLELIIFKMSGFEDYVKGKEGDDFFNSIQLQNTNNNWHSFSPTQGGYSIKLPQKPIENSGNSSSSKNYMAMYMGKDESKGYEAYDKKTDTYIFLMEKNFINYNFLEEDTFSLALANESLLSSDFLKSSSERKQIVLNNIPCIETKGKLNDGYNYTNRIFNIGYKYIAVLTKYKNDNSVANEVLNSLTLKQTNHKKANFFYDSLLKFTVTSAIAPDSLKAEFINISRIAKATNENDAKTSKTEIPYWKNQDRFVFKADSSDEEIVVESGEYPKYYSIKDSTEFWSTVIESINKKIGKYPNEYKDFESKVLSAKKEGNTSIYEILYSDTNSSQTIFTKFILHNARLYTIYTHSNKIQELTPNKKQFFESFTPVFDSATNFSLNKPKAKVYFNDYFSKDSTTSKWARKNIDEIRFVEADINDIQQAIEKLDSKNKDYFKDKTALIQQLGLLRKDSSISTILLNLYNKFGDTATFQNQCILALAAHQNQKSYYYLSNILENDPPVFDNSNDAESLFWYFKDTLQLTKKILPNITGLVNLDDYKWQVYNTIARGIDSNFFDASDYENIYSKIYFDARISLKKLLASDEKLMNKSINNNDLDITENNDNDDESKYSNDAIADDLNIYAKLLMPFWNKNQNIELFFNKLIQSRNIQVKFNTAKILYNHKKPVNDTIWKSIAKDEKNRVDLFNFLKKNKIENLLPLSFNKQNLFCKSILQDGYNKKDSLVYLNTFLQASVKNKKGNVLFFKYKNGEKDVDWKIALCGLQPIDENKVDTDETIVEFTDKVLKTNKTLKEQLEKILKEQIYSLRKSSSNFFDSNNYDYSSYFSGK